MHIMHKLLNNLVVILTARNPVRKSCFFFFLEDAMQLLEQRHTYSTSRCTIPSLSGRPFFSFDEHRRDDRCGIIDISRLT